MKVGKKLLLDEKSTLQMYRDTLKAIPLMNSNVSLLFTLIPIQLTAQKNIQQHYRMQFEKMRLVSRDAPEHSNFREGIVRTLSNLLAYDIVKQYKADPERFQKNQKNIYEADSDEEADF